MNVRRIVAALAVALVIAFGGCVFRPITNPPGATGTVDSFEDAGAAVPTANDATDGSTRASGDAGDAGDLADAVSMSGDGG